jgi:hypothetical protein
MNQIAKIIGTVVVWAACAAIVMSTGRFSSEAWVMPVIAVFSLIAATSSMRYIWRETDSRASHPMIELNTREKSKRSSRVDRLMNALDDSELDELRSRLTGDDGEQIPLESLLRRDDERR